MNNNSLPNERIVVRFSSDKDYKAFQNLTSDDTKPFPVIATVRTEETSVDYDWDTLYPNEVSSYTDDSVNFDEYEEVFVVFYPEGCKIIERPDSYFD